MPAVRRERAHSPRKAERDADDALGRFWQADAAHRPRGERNRPTSPNGTPPTELGIPGIASPVHIGSGGFSDVYRADEPDLGRQVAVKIVRVAATSDEATRRRFERECAIAGRLSSHPNVATVHRSGYTTRDEPYLVMEFFPKGSLGDDLERNGTLTVADVLRIGVRIAGALASAHAVGTVHRDVKPHNLLLSDFGEPALSDFGISVFADAQQAVTSDAFTAAHAAPELLEGGPPTPASDVYALASTLYELLAGRTAFRRADGEGILPLLRRVAVEPVPVIPRGDIPPELMATLVRGMAKGPEERYPTAEAFGRALQALERASGGAVTELFVAAPSAAPSDAAPAEEPTGDAGTEARPRGGRRPPADGQVAVTPNESPELVPPTGVAAGKDDEGHTMARPRRPVPQEPVVTPPRKRRFLIVVVAASLTAVTLLVALFLWARGTDGGGGGAPRSTTTVPTTAPGQVVQAPALVEAAEDAVDPERAVLTWEQSEKLQPVYLVVGDGDMPEEALVRAIPKGDDGAYPTRWTVADLAAGRGYCFAMSYLVGTRYEQWSPWTCIRGMAAPAAPPPSS